MANDNCILKNIENGVLQKYSKQNALTFILKKYIQPFKIIDFMWLHVVALQKNIQKIKSFIDQYNSLI